MTRFFLVFTIIAGCNYAFAVGNVPDNIDKSSATEARLRYLHAVKNYTLLTEIQIADQNDHREYKSVLFGSYYRFRDHLRAGLFYQRQYGFRHDADWFKDPTTLVWQWRNTNDRGEDLAILDISPKMVLPDHENTTLEFKTRYEYNFFNNNRSIRFRPTFTYFWIPEEEPVASFFIQAEQLFSLNYGSHGKSEQWAYLGGLYHFNSQFQLGGFLAHQWQAWSSTPEYTAITGKTYRVHADSDVLGITLILKN